MAENMLFKIFSSLRRNDVDFIVVGGMARLLHGSEFMTVDLDMVVKGTKSNFKNLITFSKKNGYKFRIGKTINRSVKPEDLFLIPFIELVHNKKVRIDAFLSKTYDGTEFSQINYQRKKIGDHYIKVATLDFLIEHTGSRDKDKLRKKELIKIKKKLRNI